MLNVVMLSVTNKTFTLSVFVLNVVMLSVIMLIVVVPFSVEHHPSRGMEKLQTKNILVGNRNDSEKVEFAKFLARKNLKKLELIKFFAPKFGEFHLI
jgi:hypothetical protein